VSSRVYVIDDDDRFRNSLCALIESVGLQVDGWGNPEDLLKKSSLHRPGCVVLDHRLPVLSGLEVLRIIRKTSSIPAILISAYADVQTAVAAMEMGASTVFEKPLADNSFLNALERFCFEDAQRTLKRQLCLAIQEEIANSEVERATLEQMRLGLSNKAIARKLSKSVKAIERQRQNVVRKLGCISALEVLQKVQTCPMQNHSPLACIKESCPAGRSIDAK
jgi:two-component system, LuxR family, response regulator FixJ